MFNFGSWAAFVLIFRFMTDFKATLLLVLAISVGIFVKTHFFGKWQIARNNLNEFNDVN